MSYRLNIMISLTRAVFRNKDRKERLQVFVKAWMYEALDMPDDLSHIVAGLYLLVKKTSYRENGLKVLSRQCDEKFNTVPKETATKLAEVYRNIYDFS